MLLFASSPVHAEADVSSFLLVSGSAFGAGGGPQTGFSIVKTCAGKKIDVDTIPIVLQATMSSLDISLEQQQAQPETRRAGEQIWNTQQTIVSSEDINLYNNLSDENYKLSTLYKYYYKMTVTISSNGMVFTVKTITNLSVGTTPENTEPYTGPFSSSFFHNRLLEGLTRNISEYSCEGA